MLNSSILGTDKQNRRTLFCKSCRRTNSSPSQKECYNNNNNDDSSNNNNGTCERMLMLPSSFCPFSATTIITCSRLITPLHSLSNNK